MLRTRFFSVLAVCAAALASTSVVFAQGASAPGKVGVVNFQQALLSTDEAKKAQADLVAEFAPRQAELEKVARTLQDDQTTLQSSQGKLSPQREAELNADIQHNQHLADRMTQDLQDDSQKKRDEMVQQMGARMTEVISKLRDEKGLDAIFDSASTIAYNKALDLTTDATAAYNKAYPVKVAAAGK